ncbi:hypothetical protein [Pseudoxanthomonas winnipegensis]|uniref:Copper resistance protein NlpE n=1 Tax=Pseudoxanthomonas winnipegensis TaxID=2480810 RepID=A0A4Q8LHG6_9GAMM|nr:hypothetical protein [Pseudoxanthomonas winnipegensis]RZZ84309.1 hypothetical protein EA662_12540 [Pseudoxanthomonas winnipegensis]TAA28921.1 hypothetical protein EA661_11520 [Pseudoxanthomonas winnipegensis]TAA41974.1 hypothetical protein EAT51_06700 [Pseudoxanthomonas winnipegensis]TBV73543.1 hypothetical protein EYC46_14460 [Pseudoxanthomonas winnipegensis]
MTRSRLLCCALLAVGLAACKPAQTPQATTPAPASTPPAQTPPPATGALAEISDKQGVVIAASALAGDFEGNASTLVIEADGEYRQTLKAGGAELTSSGTWSPAGTGVMLLTPTDKAAQAVRFDVISADELRSQDGAYVFKRVH